MRIAGGLFCLLPTTNSIESAFSWMQRSSSRSGIRRERQKDGEDPLSIPRRTMEGLRVGLSSEQTRYRVSFPLLRLGPLRQRTRPRAREASSFREREHARQLASVEPCAVLRANIHDH